MEDYVGSITLFAGTFTPNGYLECDGKLLLINEHPLLYHLLKNRFGGDGTETFALPAYAPPGGAGRYIICEIGIYPEAA